MKIAHIVCTYPPYYGGMGNVAFQMADGLSALGHEVAVYTPQYVADAEVKSADEATEETHTEELQSQIDYARRLTPSLQYGNAARMPDLEKELETFDLVHLHYPFFGTANIVRRWKIRHPDRPLVITYHMDTRGLGWKGLLFKWYSKYWMPRILGAADLLLATSFDYIEASDARGVYAGNKRKWKELPLGVDIDRFTPGEKSRTLFVRWELDRAVPTILFVGGMDEAHYFKGVAVLLEALAIVRQQGVRVQAVFVGDGSLRQSYEDKARYFGLRDTVRFVGRVEDEELPQYYQCADLLVLPSTTAGEAFGMVILEAYASGVPVIASDLPGVRQVANLAGQTFAPGDASQLAQKILGFLSPETQQNEWKKAARAIAEERFVWPRLIEQLEMWYSELVTTISRS